MQITMRFVVTIGRLETVLCDQPEKQPQLGVTPQEVVSMLALEMSGHCLD